MNIRNTLGCILLIVAAACTNDPTFYNVTVENGVKYSNFDYSTSFTARASFSVGDHAYISVYTEDPQANPDAEPIRTLWTDCYGQNECDLYLPTYLIGKQIYAVAKDRVIASTVGRGGVDFYFADSRANEDANQYLIPDPTYCGQLRDAFLQKIKRNTSDNIDIVKEMQTEELSLGVRYAETSVLFTFMHTYGWNTNFMYYYYYEGDEDPINLSNREEYINKFCNEKFLCTRGWKVYIPGSSPGHDIDNSNPELDGAVLGTEDGNGGINLCFNKLQLSCFVSNHLLYYGPNYDQKEGSEKFPANVKIGFILKSLSHKKRKDTDYNNPDKNYKHDSNGYVKYFFTNPDANYPDNTALKNNIHFCRFFASTEDDFSNNVARLVYGVEDSEMGTNNGSDRNFNDFLFMVSTTPIADIDNDEHLYSSYENATGTLLYEDLFPSQGDYDMNDVICEYRIRKRLEKYGESGVEHIRDMYIDLYPTHYGATYDDYLYARCFDSHGNILADYQLADFVNTHKMTLSYVCAYNREQIETKAIPSLKSVRIYFIKDYVPYGQTQPEYLTSDEVPFSGVDTFIWVRDTNREVHMTGKTSAGKGSTAGLTDMQLQYKAMESKLGFYPWAIDISGRRAKGSSDPGFIPVTESIHIAQEYLRFPYWVESNGASDTDWHLHHTPTSPNP